MKEYKDRETTMREVVLVACDRCGATEPVKSFDGVDVASFKHTFGFLSKKDGSKVEFDLCEKCLDEILDKEKIDYRLEGPSGFGGG